LLIGEIIMASNVKVKIEEVKALANTIQDLRLRKKTFDLINELLLNENYVLSPAAKKVHHSYTGGLIDHTLSTTRIGITISEQLERIYGLKVDKDTITSSCLLHDIYKPYTYNETDTTSNSPLGYFMDHLILIVVRLVKEGFPLKVIHAVAAHHGDSGPVRPETIEAIIVHLADYMDSKLIGDILRKAKTIHQEEIKEGSEPKDILAALKVFVKREEKIAEAERRLNQLFIKED